MRFLFRPGDYLLVTPVPLEKVNVGDVVIFRNSTVVDEGNQTVHRVIMRHGDGLVTMGDNNPKPDIDQVTTANLVGVVGSYERDGRIRPVVGGRWGLLLSQVRRWLNRLFRSVLSLGRYPYRWLRRSGLVRRVWKPKLVRVQIETEYGPLVKYIHLSRTVAIWRPHKHSFTADKPYDLVIPPPDKGGLK